MQAVRHVSGKRTSYRISKEEVVLGRSMKSDIQIASRFASKKHAVIRQAGDTFVIEDCSRNGTVVNRIVIERPFTLNDGDLITMGKTRWQFCGGELENVSDQ